MVSGVPALNYLKFLPARVIVTNQLQHLWCCQKGRTGIKSIIALYNVRLQKYCQQLEGQKIGVSVSSGFPKPGSFAQFSCISANLKGGTCNITGRLCSCLNVFFSVNPPELLPLFPFFPTKLYFFFVILFILVFPGLRFSEQYTMISIWLTHSTLSCLE